MAKEIYIHRQLAPRTYLMLKKLITYAGLLIMWIMTVHLYASFGEGWIQLAVLLMWVAGAFAIWRIPEDRENTVKEVKWGVFGYLAFLLLYRLVIDRFSQFSPDQVGVALGVNVPVSSATATIGMLQNILMWVSIGVPVAFVLWVAQKFKTHQGGKAKDQAFAQYKGVRRNG